MGGNGIENPDTKVNGNNGTERYSTNEDNMFKGLGKKIKESAGVITEYPGKNWRNIGRATAITLLLTGMAYSSACTNQDSSPTPAAMAFEQDAVPLGGSQQEETMVKPTPTVIVESTPTETPPEVDLGWHDNWELFENSFKKSAEEIEEIVKGEYEDRPVYLISSDQNGLFTDTMIHPYDEESLKTFDLINRLNDYYKFNLDDKGKELLKEYILSRVKDGETARLYLFIKNGCIYERDGSIGLITKADNEKGFEVSVYKQEDIPWDKIPPQYWGNIDNGDTVIDMSGDEVVCSCNVNDIRSSSNSAEE